MESTEKLDVVENLVSPLDVLGEMGLLAEGAEAHGDVRKSERY